MSAIATPKSESRNQKSTRKKASATSRRYRYAEVEDGPEGEEMTLQVAFSSEFPVERKANKWDVEQGAATRTGEVYLEVLSHEADDVDLSPLNNDGALLDEHDRACQLGKVNRAEISTDKKGRAVLEFDGVTDLSKTRYQQMKKRSRPHISFGYTRMKFLGEVDLGDGKIGKRFSWVADEISSVAVPADPTVGSRRAEGKHRTLNEDTAHCTKCGGGFERGKLDEDYRCEECGPVLRSKDKDFVFTLPASGTRAKAVKISFGNLRQQVESAAADHDEFCDCYRYCTDIELQGEKWSAIIYSDGEYFRVGFELGTGQVILDEEAEQVNPKQEWETIGGEERQKPGDARQNRAGEVDFGIFENVENVFKNLTPEYKMKIRTLFLSPAAAEANGVDEAAVRTKVTAELEPQLRTKITGEFNQKAAKRDPLKKEIRALAVEFIKSHGTNWSGKPGEVVVVGERIRAFVDESDAAPEDHSDSEIRSLFREKCTNLIRGSRAPLSQTEAASLDETLASRCSLKSLYNGAARAQAKGERVGSWMPTDGAEFEADKELRHKAQEFPGGQAIEMSGVCLPVNMPSGRAGGRSDGRQTRDALAGDFATAGALISPQYKFPTIELLRNKMALGRAGITILGGVIGNLVLPRQTGATVSQSLQEGAILAAYDQVFDQIRLVPHRIGSKQIYSRLALLQTTEDFEGLVMNDHMAQNALRADYLGINGAGANDEPLGILNQIGIGSVAFGGSASSAYKNIVSLETAIRKANIDEPPTYITTSTARGTLRITPATLTGSTVVSGESNALWVGDQLVGRTAVDSQQVPGDVLIALVGRHVVMAQWGGWMVVLDTTTLADADKIKLSMNTYIDYALRHPQAVARSADSLASLT